MSELKIITSRQMSKSLKNLFGVLELQPLMDEVLKLFDSCWFENEIFQKRNFESNPDSQNEENSLKPEFTRAQTIHTRSMSDQLSLSSSFLVSDSFPTDSILQTTKLHKIISGKEVTEEDVAETCNVQEAAANKKMAVKKTRKKKGMSKSLSDLEFEELKGFMDLGFVFSEEDEKDSRLVEIIPGLQRLGKKEVEVEDEEIKKEDDKVEVSRPYLSEAWEVSERRRRRRRRRESPLMNWKVPASSDEIDMKDSLRWWAHTVASTVR